MQHSPARLTRVSDKEAVRVGLVGTSWWAEAMYLPALANHPIGRITAVCGRDLDRAQNVATQWSIPQAYSDWSKMIDSGEFDAIIVASPNETHYEITMAALDRGLPVLCEKPLGMNVAEAHKMAEAAHQSFVQANNLGFGDKMIPSLFEAQEKTNNVKIIPR